ETESEKKRKSERLSSSSMVLLSDSMDSTAAAVHNVQPMATSTSFTTLMNLIGLLI
ncbi:hypothetical protein MKX01_007880, partial [Papaver californicum]